MLLATMFNRAANTPLLTGCALLGHQKLSRAHGQVYRTVPQSGSGGPAQHQWQWQC